MWLKEAPKDILCSLQTPYIKPSKLFDPVDLTSYYIFFKQILTSSLCFYDFQPNYFQNLFHTILNNTINKQTAPQTEKEKPNAVKDRGGGRFDNGQRFKGSILMASISGELNCLGVIRVSDPI